MILKHMFQYHVTHPISFHPRTSPVWKSSGLTPVLRNVPPQDFKNWLAHQPILSPGIGQESSGILQEYMGDNNALPPLFPIPPPSIIPHPSPLHHSPSLPPPSPHSSLPTTPLCSLHHSPPCHPLPFITPPLPPFPPSSCSTTPSLHHAPPLPPLSIIPPFPITFHHSLPPPLPKIFIVVK